MPNTSFTFSIEGMKCGGCVSAVETALNELGNVDDIKVSLEQHQVTVSSSRAADEIAQAITAAGFPASAV
ncbi:Lead, cadmium, zinc and mercury transporting ATPase; Copper-translocating P-type ATPase [hydrothermal vent metagenome]|uniref:Lead, cadmium, zinc and mercury transporting ATPase Copper-translocating P-type ATPase n=1 Tax=hydrothermal vent metagenome TaxID=652676 RepID=A0A3B1ALP9_9ZZZZ